MHWESVSEAAISGRARDIRKRLSEATQQLPVDRRSIVHIGFEAVDGDAVERRHYAKVHDIVRSFDPRGKRLEYVFCHYFVPKSPPAQCWAYNGMAQWYPIHPAGPAPVKKIFLVMPEAVEFRAGQHWGD
jgi:hypothetical protein